MQSSKSEIPVPFTLSRRALLRSSAIVALAVTGASSLASCAPQTSVGTVLRVGWTNDIDSLNPFTSFSTEAYDVWQLIYDRLLDYDADLKVQPVLATSFESNPDGTVFTFTIRDGVTWHDGKPLTADDVVFTFLMVRDNKLGSFAPYLTELVSAESPDASTVVLTYKVPQTLNPGLLMPIAPKHIWGALSGDALAGYANAAPVGTGPFTFGEWKKGQIVSIERNQKWWGAAPAATKVTWTVYGNDDVLAQALRTGEIDIVPQLPPTIYDNLAGASNVKPVSMKSFSFHMIGFNCDESSESLGNPLLKDVTIRQALSLAVDRKQLVELALAGHGEPGSSLIPPAFGDLHYEPIGDALLNGRPDRAVALLDAAGYVDRNGDGIRESADGAPLSFRIIAIQETTVDVRGAQLFVEAAKKVGIQLTLKTMDSNTMGGIVFNAKPDWDIMVWGWDSVNYDVSNLLGIPTTAQIGNNNDTFWSNSEYDALYVKQSESIDPAKRKELVLEAQRLHYEACPYIIMWYQDKLSGVRTDTWEGWRPIPGGMIVNFPRENYLKVTRVG